MNASAAASGFKQQVSAVTKRLVGHCLCRALSWTLPLNDKRIGQCLVCHCSTCRRVSGATSVPFVALPQQDLLPQFTQSTATLGRYQATPTATRYFCTLCGSFVAMEYHHETATLWIPIGTIDDDCLQFLAEQLDANRDSHIFCVKNRSSAACSPAAAGDPLEQAMDTLPHFTGFGTYRSDPCCGKPWDELRTWEQVERDMSTKDDSGS